MNRKPLVMLCWVQVVLAALLVLVNFASMVTRPWTGLEYSRQTGLVTEVVPGSPAERAGVRVRDRIVTFNGQAVGRDVTPLYFARADEPVPLVVERGGRTQTLAVVPWTAEEMRRSQLRAGSRYTLTAINGYLNFPLHLWMLGLGAALLVLRPNNQDARLAALSLAYWAGGTFIYRTSGFGALLESIPAALHAPLFLVNALFVGGFFAINLHFALTFPSERVEGRPRWWVVLPYVAALPIFIEVAVQSMQRVRGDVGPPRLPWSDAYSLIGTGLLVGSLIAFAVRFRRVGDPNGRRRLKLIFLSILPGSVAFILAYLVGLLQLGYRWESATQLLHIPSMIAGSAIFAYAVIRHRIFNVRVLVRRSIQYALARSTLLALMALPVIGLATFVYFNI